jgi:hypothetical protein
MVGEARAHNEATGRDLYASLIGWPPVEPPLSARGEAETRAVSAGRAVGRDGGLEASVLTPDLSCCRKGDGILD